MKITSKPSILILNLFFLSTVILAACNKGAIEDIEEIATDIVGENNASENDNSNNNNDTANDNNNDATTQTEEKEIVNTAYDQEGVLSSLSSTKLVFENGRIVKEIFPDLAAGEEGKFITKTYTYNDNQRITTIVISDESTQTEDKIYNIEYKADDVIVKIEENSAEGIDLRYQQTTAEGDWEYTNPKGEKGIIAFDDNYNWTKFEALSASTTDTSSLFFSNDYDSNTNGFYPDAPKYFSFLSWLTTVFNFYPSDGHFMTSNAFQTQKIFWGSEDDYRNQNFDQGDFTVLSGTNEYDNEENLIKLTLKDEEGSVRSVLEID